MSRLRDNERAVAPVIGVVLLLGIGVIALSGYQAGVVPSQNEQVEFEHNQEIQGDLEELRASVLDIRAEQGVNEHRPATLQLGTEYPTRVIGLNPPPPRGTVFTEDAGAVSIDDATIRDSFSGDHGNATEALLTDHETQLLAYDPDYRVFQDAPETVFEHSLLYNQFDEGDLPVTDQRLIRNDSKRINLVVFEGEVSETALQTTLDPETLDGPTAQVPIEAEDGETFNITLPTRSPEVWKDEEVIGEDFDERAEHARVVNSTPDNVTIEIEDTDDWTIQATCVGYDGGACDRGFSEISDEERAVADPTRTFSVSWLGNETAGPDDNGIDFNEGTLEINQSNTGGAVSISGSVLADNDPITDATVDVLTTNSSVASPEHSAEDAVHGNFSSVIETNKGTARLFAVLGGDVDDIEVNVSGDPEEADPQIVGGKITDNSEDSKGERDGQSSVELSLSDLTVSNAESVEGFRIEFDNQDNDEFEEFEEDSVTELKEDAAHEPGAGQADFEDEYEITIEIVDENDESIDEEVIEADADGNDIDF